MTEYADLITGEPLEPWAQQAMDSAQARKVGRALAVVDEDWLTDVISDSLDMDWNARDGARAILAALRTPTPEAGEVDQRTLAETIRDAFKREYRYDVIKRSHLTPNQQDDLNDFLVSNEINTIECVVVEYDWPEYEKAWQMIEERMTNEKSRSSGT